MHYVNYNRIITDNNFCHKLHLNLHTYTTNSDFAYSKLNMTNIPGRISILLKRHHWRSCFLILHFVSTNQIFETGDQMEKRDSEKKADVTSDFGRHREEWVKVVFLAFD